MSRRSDYDRDLPLMSTAGTFGLGLAFVWFAAVLVYECTAGYADRLPLRPRGAI